MSNLAAPDVEEALQTLRNGHVRPDFILADYRLKEGNTGAEAIQALRSAFGDAIPGVLVTGDTAVEATHLIFTGDLDAANITSRPRLTQLRDRKSVV